MSNKPNWNNYEEVKGLDVARTWPEKDSQLSEGDFIEGRYIAKKEGLGENQSTMYVLETDGGEKVGVWGSTVLDTKFASIAIGKMVAIEYLGKKPSPTKGRNPYKDFRVGQGVDVVGDEGK